MAKIIKFPVKRNYHPCKPSGPREPIGGAAAVKKSIFTQAIGKIAA